MRKHTAFMALATAAIFLTGCGSKEPATKAVADASHALDMIRPEAQQYAPNEMAAADTTLNEMKQNLSKEKYAEVINEIPKINTDYTTAREAVVSMRTLKAAAATEWTQLNEEVPKTVQELDTRVETLSAGKLPKEVTKETLASAKTDLETLKATWAEATAAASAGDPIKATDKGRVAKTTGDKLKQQLAVDATVASR
jgi:PBP1b-binding outer membrane lipoprotein LpoB